jgi:hypothetical protein
LTIPHRPQGHDLVALPRVQSGRFGVENGVSQPRELPAVQFERLARLVEEIEIVVDRPGGGQDGLPPGLNSIGWLRRLQQQTQVGFGGVPKRLRIKLRPVPHQNILERGAQPFVRYRNRLQLPATQRFQA